MVGVLRPFQEFAILNHPLEALIIDKVVIHTIGLFWPRRPGRVGDREVPDDVVLGQTIDGFTDQCRLAATRRRRDDEQDAPAIFSHSVLRPKPFPWPAS